MKASGTTIAVDSAATATLLRSEANSVGVEK
jgi:hypothetical protein